MTSGSIACPHYRAITGTRRCESYVEGGTCARPDHFLCVEWQRANAHRLPGVPVSSPAAPSSTSETREERMGEVVQLRPKDARSSAPRAQIGEGHGQGLFQMDLGSLARRGLRACIGSDTLGEIWLVPEYTGTHERELTYEHATLLSAVCAAIPGARVIELHWPESER